MRFFFCYLFVVLSSSPLFSQILNGKILNGIGEEGLANVRIEVQGLSTAFSDPQLGTFSLDLPGLRPGMKVPLDIQKDGYAVINREATQPRLPDNLLDRIKIYMAPVTQRDELALQFYKIRVARNIQLNFDKAAKEFAEQANYEAIGQLHADKEAALIMVDSLAARLARFDPQSASEELTQAMQLYDAGKVKEALAVLKVGKIVQRIQGHQEAIDQDIEALMQAGGMALSIFQFDTAQAYFEAAVVADPTKLDNLWLLCVYLFHQKQSKQLLQYAGMMKRAAILEEDEWAQLAAMGYTGAALRLQHQAAEAIIAYEEAVAIGEQLAKKDPQIFESELATILSNLGNAYADLGRYAEAISFYDKALDIQRKLPLNDPNHYERNLALTLNSLGIAYRNQAQYDKAASAYEEALIMYQKLSEDSTQFVAPDAANTLNNLGVVFSKQNLPKQAAPYYKKALEIYRELFEVNPQSYESELAMTLLNLGQANVGMKQYATAISLYEEALEIRRRLVKRNPERFEPDLAMSLNNLGVLFGKKGQYAQAVVYLEEVLEIRQRLAKANPGRFELDLAKTLNNLGNCYGSLNRSAKALAAYEQALEIRSRGARATPQIYSVDLGDSYFSVANASRMALQFPQAVRYFQLADSAYRLGPASRGVQQNVSEAQYWIRKLSEVDILSQTLDEKGMAFYERKQYDSAEVYFRQAIHEYEAIPEKDLSIQARYQASFTYEHLNRFSRDRQIRYQYQQTITQYREATFSVYPENTHVQAKLAYAHSYLSWFALFVEEYAEAESSAQRALELAPESVSVLSNLAFAHLLQGKYEKAKTIFQTYADQAWPFDRYSTFREAFLVDLNELENAGITHPDIATIREWLLD